MNAWLSQTMMSMKLTLRDRQALFWIYVFPLFFLFVLASIFVRGPRDIGTLMAGLLSISAMSAGFFGLSIELVVARERGILRRYRLAPIRPWVIISGEICSAFLIVLSTLVLQLVMARIVYGLSVAGSLWHLLVMLGVGALAFLALGFVIASVAENAKVAQVVGNLLFFPLMFLGGAAIPLQFLPPAMKNIARLMPSAYLVDGLGRIITGGLGLGDVLLHLTVLATTFMVATIIAAKLFRWESREPLPPAKKAWVGAIVLIFVIAALWTSR